MSDDIEDLVETERYREILEMKKRVLDTRDEIDRAKMNGRISQARAIGLYQRKVRDYVMAVETVLNPSRGDPSTFWEETHVGDFTLPDGEVVQVDGLKEFLDMPMSFDVQVETEQQRSYRHAAETSVQTRRVRPPEKLIERAFRMTNQALDSAGFDLDEPSDKQKSGFDRVDDVEKATKILDFLRSLDEDGLREVKQVIDRDLLGPDELSNGHHE